MYGIFMDIHGTFMVYLPQILWQPAGYSIEIYNRSIFKGPGELDHVVLFDMTTRRIHVRYVCPHFVDV